MEVTVTKPPLLDETGKRILAVLTSGFADIVEALTGGDTPSGGTSMAGAIDTVGALGVIGIAGTVTYQE